MDYFQNPFFVISALAQCFCIYHVIKHRKSLWWILFIVAFPMLGCLWYFMREVRGASGSTHMKRRMVNLNPGKEPASKRLISELESQLEVTDTVALRLKLADAHLELGDYDQAVIVYKSCLRGYHKDDPVILYGLSRALVAADKPSEALTHLTYMEETGRTDYKNERTLLKAQALESVGNTADAEQYYEQASNRLPGEEARCRYAEFLTRTGNQDKAKTLFEETLRNGERGDKDYRDRNQEWIAIAKRAIKN